MTEKNQNGLIETRVRVLDWNIWWRFGPWQERAPAIFATLSDLDADIIALQEVWSDATTNYAAILADELGCHHVHGTGMEQKGLRAGNAILSRWPITRHQMARLYDQKGIEENRVAIFAEIDGPRGQLPVFSTHLNWKQHHSHIRQRQVGDLARFVAKNHAGNYPPIVCGDFNADPQSDEIRMMTGQAACPVQGLVFHDAWASAGSDGPGYTWDNRNPFACEVLESNRRIDYIFAGFPGSRGAGHIVDCQIAGNQPVDGVWPSDHFALLAELRY